MSVTPLLAASELQLLVTLSELLKTVIVPSDPLSCGVRNDRGVCQRGDAPPNELNLPHWLNRTKVAWPGEFPWLAPLHWEISRRAEKPVPRCNGVLVHPQAVLVSASCYEEDTPRTVRLADYNRNTELDQGRPSLEVGIKKVVYHPQYRSEGPAVVNDMALLILETPARLSEDVNVICLPQWSDAVEGPSGLAADWEATDCVLHGWDDHVDIDSPVPLWEKVQFLSHSSCQTTLRYIGKIGALHTLHESFACAFAEQRCWADGGSVLACRLRQDRSRWVLVGLRPYSPESENCGEVVTYTNVGMFAGWIRDTITAELSALN